MPKDIDVCSATAKLKVRRPPNSWILFRCDMLKKLRAGGQLEMTQASISKHIAYLWARAAPEVRAHWEQAAESAKLDHMTRNPGYKYVPMRKEEKDRERERKRFVKRAAKARHRRANPDSNSTLILPVTDHDSADPESQGLGGQSSETLSYAYAFSSLQPAPVQCVPSPVGIHSCQADSTPFNHELNSLLPSLQSGGIQEPMEAYIQDDIHRPWNMTSDFDNDLDHILATSDLSVFRLDPNQFDVDDLGNTVFDVQYRYSYGTQANLINDSFSEA